MADGDTDDSVSLDDMARESAREKKKSGQLFGFKTLVALFLIFVLVVSDVFNTHVVSGFRGAVNQRTPTSYGVAVQGIFLVIFFILAVHMIDGDLI